MADSLSHITKLIQSSYKSDEDFAAEFDDFNPQTIKSLQDFLQIVSDSSAGVTIESGAVKCELSPEQVMSGYRRVSETSTEETESRIEGVLRGITLDSGNFDFLPDNGTLITGKIDEQLTESQVSDYIKNFFNQLCRASFQEERIRFQNGRERTSCILSGIERLSD